MNVKMTQIGDLIKLQVMDNGAGLPNEFNINNTKSLGMNLMKGLTNQLKGKFTLEEKNGVCLTIQFTIEKGFVTN